MRSAASVTHGLSTDLGAGAAPGRYPLPASMRSAHKRHLAPCSLSALATHIAAIRRVCEI